LLIGHFSSRYRSLDGLLKEARETFDRVQLAEEGKCYPLQTFQPN
jgi:ribonuclease Z